MCGICSFSDEILVELQPKGPEGAQVTWDLPDEFRDWAYGVDVAYRLKQKGNCPPQYMPPVTLHNQQNRVIMLEVREHLDFYLGWMDGWKNSG